MRTSRAKTRPEKRTARPTKARPIKARPTKAWPIKAKRQNLSPPPDPYLAIAPDVKLGQGVKLARFINLYGCEVGDHSKIGAFVEIQKNARVGRNCKISSHSFICEGVTIEDGVFIGHGVTFINDTYPRATNADGSLQSEADWQVEPTRVKQGASVGSGSTILANLTIGENAMVGAGSVVTRDVPAHAVVAGNPARILRFSNALPMPGSRRERPPQAAREAASE